MASVGLCILCNVEVTQDDYRREIDCPSKTCPGRVFHEECISAYLRKTKYSKDRCTGFPCPAILQTGKPCPGYVCKMHEFFPSNQKKKQARLDAAIAVAAAPKPRPTSVKPKATVQVAMKNALPKGVVPGRCRKAAQTGIARAAAKKEILKANAEREPNLIPGLSAEALERDARRAVARKLKAQLKIPPGATKRYQDAKAGDLSSNSNARNRIVGVGCKLQATIKDTSGGTPGLFGGVDSLRPNRRSPQDGDDFISALRSRKTGGSTVANVSSCTGDEAATHHIPDKRFQTRPPLNSSIGSDSATPASDSPLTCSDPTMLELYGAWENVVVLDTSRPLNGEVAASVMVVADQGDDPVVEYDMLYAADDGSYLVFDTFSNSYFRLEDMYGLSPELVDCAGEDGNIYICVIVRRSTRALRAQQQLACFKAQELNQQQPQGDQVTESRVEKKSVEVVSSAPATPPLEGEDINNTSAGEGVAAQVVEDGEFATDLDSLMQLLCV
ncbi:hypothetical protein VaNZ11_010869 [Volvox africanus]|uniref:RING-type domain-containing protein n=1 Tax=Volvox africanus TaxID=51714 RepID=A0ABQ5SAL5_9CHLO|nr:hypothetical protein VaNZ11_010869 [Volvox africanus]